MRILGVSGSLREASFNTSLLRAAVEAAPEGIELELWEGLGDLPLYDADLERRCRSGRTSGTTEELHSMLVTDGAADAAAAAGLVASAFLSSDEIAVDRARGPSAGPVPTPDAAKIRSCVRPSAEAVEDREHLRPGDGVGRWSEVDLDLEVAAVILEIEAVTWPVAGEPLRLSRPQSKVKRPGPEHREHSSGGV
jgi:hypothetical protein